MSLVFLGNFLGQNYIEKTNGFWCLVYLFLPLEVTNAQQKYVAILNEELYIYVAIFTGAYVWLVALCRGSRPMLQLYSLMFGVGALFAPLLAKPFLSKDRLLFALASIKSEHTIPLVRFCLITYRS